MQKFKLLFFIILCIGTVTRQSFSQRTIRMNLERIVSDASFIVHGKVISVESKIDPETNILSTFVTINVIEKFFGAPGQQLLVKMIGGQSKNRTMKFSGMPVFKEDEEIISMFYKPSKLGFTSPVGMGQGTFRIIRDTATNITFVKNGLNNIGLFDGMINRSVLSKTTSTAASTANITADDFTKTLRSLITILKKQ